MNLNDWWVKKKHGWHLVSALQKNPKTFCGLKLKVSVQMCLNALASREEILEWKMLIIKGEASYQMQTSVNAVSGAFYFPGHGGYYYLSLICFKPHKRYVEISLRITNYSFRNQSSYRKCLVLNNHSDVKMSGTSCYTLPAQRSVCLSFWERETSKWESSGKKGCLVK